MAKRPKFSRWRRLPPVFRTGEHRPIGTGNELDRIILYLPSRVLDLAEVLAERAGIPAIQEYCERLLIQAIEAEQVRQKVSGFEVRRGPLEGLKQVAEDPDYLAEWRPPAEAGPKPTGLPRPPADAIAVDLVLSDGDEPEMDPELEEDPPTVPRPDRERTRVHADPDAMGVLVRHVAHDRDEQGFLPCLRRGAAVPGVKSAELLHALTQLEVQHRGADVLDRGMAHALHRLALESQVLLTDAWPGAFDDRMIAAIRAVQEAVERVLSGQDIRYS